MSDRVDPADPQPSPAPGTPGAPRSRVRGVLRGAHVTLLGGGLGGVLAIVNEVICARHLGVGAYGLYAFALIIARIAEGIATLGLPVGALHHIAIYRDQEQPRKVWGTILASVLPPLLIGCLFSALLWWLAPLIAERVFGNAEAVAYLRAMSLAIPFMGLSEVLGVITRGFGYAAYYVVVRSLVPPVCFFAMLLLIMSQGLDTRTVPAAFAIAYGLAVVAGLIAVWRVGGPSLFRTRPQIALRALYGYSMPVLMNHLMYLVVACVPILMLGVTHGDKAVGIFRACMQLVIPFDMVVIAFNAAAGQHYAVLAHNERRAELAVLVERITGFMTPLAMVWLLVLVFNRHELMHLLGPDFEGGTGTLLVMALAQATLCSVGTAGYLLVMSGRQRYETVNAAVAAVVCIIISYGLVGPFGTLGAATATLTACLVASGMRIAQVRRLTGIRIVRASLLRVVGLALVTAAAMLLLTAHLPIGPGRGAGGLIVRNLVLAVLFGSLYWSFGVDKAVRRHLIEVIERKFASVRRRHP